ncbi:winged helix-turn-helix transcriptional regulator [Halomonas sp. GXIMD04776]|uniref:winged helix-turn-helix transcriptional regulator n=1 Tax=Halomonas sp. GXIMD04776 TaxID=3415605 RepID=UPI003C93AB72
MRDDPHSGRQAPGAQAKQGLPANCPADKLLRLLWGEWTVHILWVLGETGPQRFVGLRDLLDGVSAKVLTERLRRMEGDGLIWRDQKKSVPPKVTYGLTEDGMELHKELMHFEPLAEQWYGAADRPRRY